MLFRKLIMINCAFFVRSYKKEKLELNSELYYFIFAFSKTFDIKNRYKTFMDPLHENVDIGLLISETTSLKSMHLVHIRGETILHSAPRTFDNDDI